MEMGKKLLLVHEMPGAEPDDRGSAEFASFFETTPQLLLVRGIYNVIATPFKAGEFRKVSLNLLAAALGGVSQELPAAQPRGAGGAGAATSAQLTPPLPVAHGSPGDEHPPPLEHSAFSLSTLLGFLGASFSDRFRSGARARPLPCERLYRRARPCPKTDDRK